MLQILGNHDLLKFIVGFQDGVNIGRFRENADRACCCGSISLINLLTEMTRHNSIQFRPTPSAYRNVIKNQSGLEFVQYLRENMKVESCIVAGDKAAEVGNENIIKYLLKESDVDIFSPMSFIKAADNGHLHVLDFVKIYFPYFIDIALELGSKSGHIDTVKYLLKSTITFVLKHYRESFRNFLEE